MFPARTLLPLLTGAAVFALSCGPSPFDVLGGSDGADDPGAQNPRPRFEDYIRGDRFPKLTVEVDSVPGFEPRPANEAAMSQTLGTLLDKPGGVAVVRDGTVASRGADHAWTFEELQALADEHFGLEEDANTLKMHVLFVDGRWHGDEGGARVLGLAWAHTHVVMFKQTIEETCQFGPGGVLSEKLCENAEHGVWLHELGHLLGLVNIGLPMVEPHEDPEHPGHDHNQGCVMYWAYESGNLIDVLRDRLVEGDDSKLDFDAACRADIAAQRGAQD